MENILYMYHLYNVMYHVPLFRFEPLLVPPEVLLLVDEELDVDDFDDDDLDLLLPPPPLPLPLPPRTSAP